MVRGTPGPAWSFLSDGWTRPQTDEQSALSREVVPQGLAAKVVPHSDAGVTRKSRRVPLSGYAAVGS